MFGGRTANVRDARVRSLIDSNIKLAAVKRTAPPVAEGTAMAETKLPAKPPTPARDPREDTVSVTASTGPSPGSTEPIKPIAVKTLNVQGGARMSRAFGIRRPTTANFTRRRRQAPSPRSPPSRASCRLRRPAPRPAFSAS